MGFGNGRLVLTSIAFLAMQSAIAEELSIVGVWEGKSPSGEAVRIECGDNGKAKISDGGLPLYSRYRISHRTNIALRLGNGQVIVEWGDEELGNREAIKLTYDLSNARTLIIQWPDTWPDPEGMIPSPRRQGEFKKIELTRR